MIVKVAVPEKFKLKVVPDFRTLIFGGQKEIHYIGGTDVLPPPPGSCPSRRRRGTGAAGPVRYHGPAGPSNPSFNFWRARK